MSHKASQTTMNLQHANWRPEHHSKRREECLYKQFLNNASQRLSFSEEVIYEMGAISYRKFDFSWLFHATGPLAPCTTLKKKKKHGKKKRNGNIDTLTQEEGIISLQAPAQNKTNLLQLRKQQRIPGYGLSPVSTNVQNHLNKTATTLTIKHIEIPQAPRLQDILNPRAGSHVTENVFTKEIFSGRAVKAEQQWVDHPTRIDYAIKQGLRPPDVSGQDPEMPKQSGDKLSTLRYAVDKWRIACNVKLPLQSVNIEGLKRALSDPNYTVRLEAIITCASRAVNGPQEELHPGRAVKAEQRWVDHPTRIDYALKQGLRPPDVSGQDPKMPKQSGAKLSTLRYAVDKWRIACNVTQHSKEWKLKAAPQELQALIASALEDPVKRVQTAAAVCQYATRTPNTHARDILRSTIKQDPSGTGADSWVAAQCLAIDGDVSQAVIQRLLSQHFLRDALPDQEQSMTLLSNISSKTTLVRSLLAEELNTANWRTRVQACTSIAQLRSQINKDLCNKLMHMMWNDWSCAVRHAAALALSKLNVAREMHSELSAKLEEGPTACRLEALILIGQLKIMTPKLLPTFLRCFSDDFVTVRKQACLTAASLMMEDQSVVDQLMNLMQNEPIGEVKVEAINALKKIGWMNPAVQELLMWAVHHEEEPSVRIAACEALSTLDAKGPELQHFLQERYALEPNAEVQRHVKGLLEKHGYSLQGDESKIHEIKLQMELLCAKHIITQKVLLIEEMGKQQQQK